MTWETSSGSNALRSLRWLLSALVVAVMPATSFALTASPFVPVRQPLTNEIAALSAIEDPSPAERARLRVLNRADKIFANSALNDGKALRLLNNNLRRFPEYTLPLDTVASNLVLIFTNEYSFVGSLLQELPPAPTVPAIIAKYDALAPAVAKLTATVNAAKTSVLYDPVKRRLDNVFSMANQALLIPFPSDLTTNSIEAKVDDGQGPKSFTASSTAASENVFQAIVTGNNIAITVSAIDYPRGLLFSIPNVQPGTFRYEIPDAISFTNRTDIYRPGERNVAATNGAFFIGTTAKEAYGSFECSGPDFGIVSGRFRITLSSQP